jgi:hypothetical protein
MALPVPEPLQGAIAPVDAETGNLRAVQLLLGHTKLESTVRCLGIEVDDALAIYWLLAPAAERLEAKSARGDAAMPMPLGIWPAALGWPRPSQTGMAMSLTPNTLPTFVVAMAASLVSGTK